MITCKITIKIKDYFPKIDTIPYENYVCLFTCGEYEGQIPFLPDDSKIIQHQIKNISSDIKYKVHILDYNDMSLIGMCEMTVSYQVISQIIPPNGFIQEQQKKLLIDLKTKRKLFGTIVNIGDIYLNIFAEVFIISRQNIDLKIGNKKKKNYYQNTPQCYIKYSFQINNLNYSPKSSKNISSLINNNSEKYILNNNKQEKFISNKHSNINLINYKINMDKGNDDNNKKTYSNFNNNTKKGFKNYSSRLQQKKYPNNNISKEQNKKTIMDLLQQRKMIEKKLEKNNLKKEGESEGKFDKNNIDNKDNNNIQIKNEGYLTEQNFNPHIGIRLENKYIINNDKFKKKSKDNIKFDFQDNLRNEKSNNMYNDANPINKENNDDKFDNNNNFEIKNNFNNIIKNEDNSTFIKNLSITVKSNNKENLNNKYIYKSKNKIVKMGKGLNKNKFNSKNNNNLNQIQDNILNSNNFSITVQNEISENKIDNIYNNKNNNINATLLSTYSGEEDYSDIDRMILEKGAKLRNNFHIQLKQNPPNNNNIIHHNKNINTINNNKNNNKINLNKEENNQNYSEFQNINDSSNNYFLKNDNNNGIVGSNHFNMGTPRTEKMSQYSSSQSLNNALIQENIANNCIKLIEFYSLLNFKLKKIYPKNLEIKKKLLIFKELFSTELKKSNKIINISNINQLIYHISSNINGPLNEKILYLFPKIKKLETSIYKNLFGIYYTNEEVIKFKEYENYENQTKIFLLLTITKNLINKYGNISQIFAQDKIKKNILKQFLINYDLTEKEEGEKDFVNLEVLSNEIKMKNKNEMEEFNEQIDDKFKVIKEVDEDKEEENDEEEEEINDDNINKIKNSNKKEKEKNTNNNKEKKLKKME